MTLLTSRVFAQQINSFIFWDLLRSKNYLGRDSGPLNIAPTPNKMFGMSVYRSPLCTHVLSLVCQYVAPSYILIY